MFGSPFESLFAGTAATARVVSDPSPDDLDPYKIPLKIVKHARDNNYSGDGTVHPGDHLLFLHELCELFKCAGITTDQVKRKLFTLSLTG